MRHPTDPVRNPWLRRLVLGTAIVLGVAAGLPRGLPDVDAATIVVQGASPGTASTPSAAPAVKPEPAPQAAPATPDADDDEPAAADAGSEAGSEVTIDHRGVTVRKGGRHVNMRGFGTDREYDSFQDFVNDAPWLAGLVFLTVLLLFLTPLLIVVLLVWYKIRKTRMQNETMLKLAEKGIVPPAEAMESLAPSPAAAAGLSRSAEPLYEQARQLRQRAAWSDLRKGVILISIGLAFTFYSMLDDGTPNWIGLILLFLGIGYSVLWFFEDRQGTPPRRDAGVPPPGSA
jgi:uncharacterized protein DUF6249